MRNSDAVEVRALEVHHDPAALTDWRVKGERYETTTGLARRRERAGLVEIEPDKPPEEESEPQEDAQEGQANDENEQTEAQETASADKDDEEAEHANT